jgi:voltage-gated potassium channel
MAADDPTGQRPRAPFAPAYLVKHVRLPKRGDTSPLTSLLIRVAIALGCLVVCTLVVYAGRAGYRDNGTGEPVNLLAALYYSTVSLSTTGYGDITPVSDAARWTNILVVTPLRLLFLIVLVGTAIEQLTQNGRTTWAAARWERRVRDHTVVIGYGVKARTAIQTLEASGYSPRDIVVMSRDEQECADAQHHGHIAIYGDALEPMQLRAAGVPRAKQCIVATETDDTTMLATVAVRRLNDSAPLAVPAREIETVDLLRAAGARRSPAAPGATPDVAVVLTAASAGRMLALALESPVVGHLLTDLLDPVRGLQVIQRPVRSAEAGRTPADLGDTGSVVLATAGPDGLEPFDRSDRRVLTLGEPLVVISPVEPIGSHHDHLAEVVPDSAPPGADGRTVVVGFGVKGRTAVETLLEFGAEPDTITVLADARSCQDAETLGVRVQVGDGHDPDDLAAAGVPTASRLMVATDRDDTTLLVTLAMRSANVQAPIAAAIRESDNAELLEATGARHGEGRVTAVLTAASAGQLLALSLLSPLAGEMAEDLLDPRDGLEVVEVAVDREMTGRTPARMRDLGNVVLAVQRDGAWLRFDEWAAGALAAGDRVVVIKRVATLSAAAS